MCLHIQVWFCWTGNNNRPGVSPEWPLSGSGRALTWINQSSCFTESDTLGRTQSWVKCIGIQTSDVTIKLKCYSEVSRELELYSEYG